MTKSSLKKTPYILSLAILIAITFLFTACKSNDNTKISYSAEDIYAMGAITCANLYLEDFSSNDLSQNTLLASSINDFNKEDIFNIKAYLPTIEGLLMGNGKLFHSQSNAELNHPTEVYEKSMSLSYTDTLNIQHESYMLYNENAIHKDDANKELSQIETELNGNFVTNGIQYQIIANKTLSNNNFVIQLKLMSKENTNRYATMTQIVKNNENYFNFEMCEINNNEVQSIQKSTVSLTKNKNKTLFNLNINNEMGDICNYTFQTSLENNAIVLTLNYSKTYNNANKSGVVKIKHLENDSSNFPIYEFIDNNNNPIQI